MISVIACVVLAFFVSVLDILKQIGVFLLKPEFTSQVNLFKKSERRLAKSGRVPFALSNERNNALKKLFVIALAP